MWFLILIFMLEVLGTTYNILKLKKNGLDAIPLANLIIKFISKVYNFSKNIFNKDKIHPKITEWIGFKSK